MNLVAYKDDNKKKWMAAASADLYRGVNSVSISGAPVITATGGATVAMVGAGYAVSNGLYYVGMTPTTGAYGVFTALGGAEEPEISAEIAARLIRLRDEPPAQVFDTPEELMEWLDRQ